MIAGRDRDRQTPDATRLRQFAERAGIADNEQVQNLLAVAAASPNDHVPRQVHRVLQVAASDHAGHPFESPAVRELATVPGDCLQELDLGTVVGSAAGYTLDENVLTRHMLITGETGAGKTTLLYNLMDDLTTPYWAFDLKTDYRHRLHTDPDLIVLPWNRFQFNPLHPPPGVPPRRWAQTVHELFGDAYGLLSASQHYLLPHLLDLYDDHGVLDDPPTADTRFPTMQDLYQYLKKHGETGRVQSNYLDRLLSRLRATLAATDHLFDAQTGHPFPQLLDDQQNIVFELDGLGTDHQDFLMEWLLVWLYTYQATQQDRGNDLDHVLIMDEGKRAFSVYKERSDAKGLPTIDTVLAKLREFQIGVVVADQEPAKLTDSLLANTYTKILFHIGDHDQFQRMAASMDLDQRQQEYTADLGVGQAVIQTGSAPALPVDLHDTAIEKTVTDTELQDRMQETWTSLRDRQSDSTLPGADEADEPGDTGESRVDDPEDAPLSNRAERLLTDVVENPYVKLSDRYSRLFSSRYKGNKAKTELRDRGLVREQAVEKKFGRPTLLELTADGRTWLQEEGMSVHRTGRGGIVHRYWQHLLKNRFEQAGYTAVREQDDADLAVTLNDGRIAVEVAMEAVDRELEHVRQRLQNGFDSVWIGCRNEAVKAELEQMLAESELSLDHVHVRLLQDLQTASLERL